nr:MAG TPA: hypothetical protein [Caudoviricetes sp.]
MASICSTVPVLLPALISLWIVSLVKQKMASKKFQ